MNDLLGRRFALDCGHYRVVDVLNLGGEIMLYAERAEGGPARVAFHYADVAALLKTSEPA